MRMTAYKKFDSWNKSFITLFFLIVSCSANAVEPDWSDYDTLLRQYVSEKTRQGVKLAAVDYAGLQRDPLYLKVVELIQGFDINKLQGKQEKLAFYINAYNIFAMKMVIDHWPVASIKDAGSLFSSVWKKNIGRIDHKAVSLHYIEHGILRKMHEPRIHMAIVCASVSCPDLRREAYIAARLDAQLDDQARRFLANPAKGLRLAGDKVIISKIFDWFGDDFAETGGVIAFLRKYRPDLPASVKIDDYFDYNWNLNN